MIGVESKKEIDSWGGRWIYREKQERKKGKTGWKRGIKKQTQSVKLICIGYLNSFEREREKCFI